MLMPRIHLTRGNIGTCVYISVILEIRGRSTEDKEEKCELGNEGRLPPIHTTAHDKVEDDLRKEE